MPSSDNKNKDKNVGIEDDVTSDKLCEEIYRNATADREKASMLITNLWKEVTSDPDKHALFGTAISKYLERMAKSNDQLIKLAELVQKKPEEETEETIDAADLYTKISAGDE